MDVTDIANDLIAEQEALDAIVADLTEEQWRTATASPRWNVADQIGHLTFFDGTAALAITDPDGFVESRTQMMQNAFVDDPDEADNATLGEYRSMTGAELLSAWRSNRQALAAASATLANDTRVEWYGPSMGSKSFLTARLMEAWAHGQHVADALGAERPATDRLRHIAQLGFITRAWTYINRKAEMPEGDVHVALVAPSGDAWTWGPEDATSTVTGKAEDFCLVVTQCRNVADTDLQVTGEPAIDWMSKAQAFAGGVTDGPAAGSFS